MQLGEVGGTVDQWRHDVAGRPGGVAGVRIVESGVGVVALGCGQEPSAHVRVHDTDLTMRATASVTIAGDVARLNRTKPRPVSPNEGPDGNATRPRSRRTTTGSSPHPNARQSSHAK